MAENSNDIVNTLPKITELSKYVYPRLFTQICSVQPTDVPIAASYGVTLIPKNEPTDPDPTTDADGNKIYELDFKFKLWKNQVKNKMFKTPISLELLQDMRTNGLNPNMIMGFLADTISDTINTEIITDLLAISTEADTAIEINSNQDSYEECRILYAQLHRKFEDFIGVCNASPTFVVVDKTSFSMILGSGMAKTISVGRNKNIALCNSGLIVFQDITGTLVDKAVFGINEKLEEGFELSSLVFSPFIPNLESKDIGSDGTKEEVDLLEFNYQHLYGVDSDNIEYITQLMGKDSASFNNVYGISSRYAITAPPFGDNESGIIDFSNIPEEQKNKLVISYNIVKN